MKRCIRLLLFLLPLATAAQSSLPPCSQYGYMHNCIGAITFTNGDKYVGEFKELFVFNKPNGQGTYTFANGNNYVGEFKDGKFHGQGTLTLPHTGNTYVGGWKYDKRDGEGVEYKADGSVVYSGIWDNDKLVVSRALDTQRFFFKPSALASSMQSPVASPEPIKINRDLPAAKIEVAQGKCKDLGFKPKTEGFGKCVLQLSK